jgi:hypothetical protein
MNTNTNSYNNLDDNIIKNQIENILLLRNYINDVLDEIKNENESSLLARVKETGNIIKIQNLSLVAEKIFNNIVIDSDIELNSNSEPECLEEEKLQNYNTLKSVLHEEDLDKEYERLEKLHKSLNNNPVLELLTDSNSLISKPINKDKLSDEFLNNNLDLTNYYYLKSLNIFRVTDYIKQSYIY